MLCCHCSNKNNNNNQFLICTLKKFLINEAILICLSRNQDSEAIALNDINKYNSLWSKQNIHVNFHYHNIVNLGSAIFFSVQKITNEIVYLKKICIKVFCNCKFLTMLNGVFGII